ncbi:hypothetical protein QAD02_006658 [Eretmocerus hayati]|uniref:Uncharacterized protein n=1 Tax=Eretmocerus hayati TaxID=131215 RepID=A0ACC2N2A8_9HYME|nr:hypothetical protein QAD02_006658 [Eretmocerus hayati]
MSQSRDVIHIGSWAESPPPFTYDETEPVSSPRTSTPIAVSTAPISGVDNPSFSALTPVRTDDLTNPVVAKFIRDATRPPRAQPRILTPSMRALRLNTTQIRTNDLMNSHTYYDKEGTLYGMTYDFGGPPICPAIDWDGSLNVLTVGDSLRVLKEYCLSHVHIKYVINYIISPSCRDNFSHRVGCAYDGQSCKSPAELDNARKSDFILHVGLQTGDDICPACFRIYLSRHIV